MRALGWDWREGKLASPTLPNAPQPRGRQLDE